MTISVECFCGLLDGMVHGVTLGCVNGDPEVQIERHIIVDSRATWEVMPTGVTGYKDK